MAPAQQRFAAGHLVAAQIDQRLVVDFEAAVGHRLAQILLHGQPGLGAGVHRRLEEAVGAAAAGLGAVHRQIGVLDQLVEIGAVLRRQRDADPGVGRQLMAEALVGLADRVVDPRDEFHDLVGALTPVWITANSSPPSRAIRSLVPDAALDAAGDGLQQFVADMMAERIVDALEFVDVDIEQGELLAAAGLLELALDLLAEQHAVRQVGQRVVMREMGDLLVGAPAFGDVLDDVDDVAGSPASSRIPMRFEVMIALAHRLAFPDVLAQEQAVGLPASGHRRR